MAGVEGLEPPTPGFGGREALFGLILAHISRFDFSGFSALLQERDTDPITLFLGPHLGPRFQTTTAAANKRLLTSRNLPGFGFLCGWANEHARSAFGLLLWRGLAVSAWAPE